MPFETFPSSFEEFSANFQSEISQNRFFRNASNLLSLLNIDTGDQPNLSILQIFWYSLNFVKNFFDIHQNEDNSLYSADNFINSYEKHSNHTFNIINSTFDLFFQNTTNDISPFQKLQKIEEQVQHEQNDFQQLFHKISKSYKLLFQHPPNQQKCLSETIVEIHNHLKVNQLSQHILSEFQQQISKSYEFLFNSSPKEENSLSQTQNEIHQELISIQNQVQNLQNHLTSCDQNFSTISEIIQYLQTTFSQLTTNLFIQHQTIFSSPFFYSSNQTPFFDLLLTLLHNYQILISSYQLISQYSHPTQQSNFQDLDNYIYTQQQFFCTLLAKLTLFIYY
jgi:hypothetical protein